MDNEALNYAYDLFVNDGYGNSPEDFNNLMVTNPTAVDYAFQLFKKDGYGDTIDDFKLLIKPSHISFDDLQKASVSGGGGEPTWKDELFHSEENVLENLKEFYKDQEGVTFKTTYSNRDEIWVKNKAGDQQKFMLPSSWNRNRVGGLGSFIAPIIGEREVGTWESFHEDITDFIQSGSEKSNPELAKDRKNVRAHLNMAFDNE